MISLPGNDIVAEIRAVLTDLRLRINQVSLWLQSTILSPLMTLPLMKRQLVYNSTHTILFTDYYSILMCGSMWLSFRAKDNQVP